jgi:predicted nucleotidyltransferase
MKVLRTLFQEALPQLDAAALGRETGKSVAGVHKALAELLPTRVVVAMRRGRTTYYAANADSHWYADILQLFRSERERTNAPHLFPTYWNHLQPLADHVAAHRGVLAVLLYGSLVRPPIYPTADVDLLIVVEDAAPLPRIEGALLGHKVSPLILTRASFERKSRADDAFIVSVLEREIVLFQDPDYELPGRSSRARLQGQHRQRRKGG